MDLKAAENIDDAARLVENVVAEKPELAVRAPELPAAVYDQSGYDLIQTGWKSLYQSLDVAARKFGKRKLDARKPNLAIDFLKKKSVLTDDLHDAIAKLWKVRNQVRHNGPSRFELSNISDSEAREFFETATRIAAMLTEKAPATYLKASEIAASLTAKFPRTTGPTEPTAGPLN